MTKKDLTAALEIKKNLSRLETRLSDLEATGGVRTSLQPAGGRGGPQSNAVIIAGELAEEIAALRRQLEKQQNYIEVSLNQVEMDKTERKLMMLRYVKGMKWKYISMAIGYAERQTLRIHMKAMGKVLRNG